MNKRDKIYETYFKDLLESQLSYKDKDNNYVLKIDFIEKLLSTVTKFSCDNLSKIKAIIGYRFKNSEEINILNNIDNICLNDIEKRLLDDIIIFGELYVEITKKISCCFNNQTNLYDEILSYIKSNKHKYDMFFKYLLDRMTILIEYIKLSYLNFFNEYVNCDIDKNPCKMIIYTSIYLEYLKIREKTKEVGTGESNPFGFSGARSERQSKDDLEYIEILIKGTGPFFTKILQRFGSLETVEDKYRIKISNSYEELPNMTKYDIESMKEFLTNKKQLIDDNEKDKIKNFNFSEPISVASIGQVHMADVWEEKSEIKESVILKFVKPRTIVYLMTEILMIKQISETGIIGLQYPELGPGLEAGTGDPEDDSLKKKVKDFLYFFAIYVISEFNFKKEKQNLLKCENTYKYCENNILKIKCATILEKEPFSLGGIPYFWMKASKGDTINKIIKKGDNKKCKLIIPQMKKLLKIWIISSLFQESEFHVDLHPGNIIADEEGNLTLIDFGNCCILNSEDRSALIKCIEWHEKVVKMVNRLIYKGKYIGDNPDNYSELNILETIKLGEINQGEILYYVKQIISELIKIMKISITNEDFNELVYKTSTEFYMKDSYRTVFGAMTEYMINNTKDIGIFSRSKVLEFSKGIITLDKTWMQICLLCKDENLNKNSVHVGFDQLSLIEKLQLYKKIQQYK